MSEPDELVLTVPASEVDCLFRGLGDKGPSGSIARPVWLPGDGFDLGGWLSLHAEFRRRSKVEHDETLRHLSTYCVIRMPSGEVFTYRRGVEGGEARLHGKRSLGVGGHVRIEDFLGVCGADRLDGPALIEGLDYAASREIHEEAEGVWATGDDRRFVGLIASSDDPVSRVHLGVVYVWGTLPYDGDADPVAPKEGCLEDAEWWTVEELRVSSLPLESWSRIVLDHLPLPARPGPVGEARER